MISRSAVEEAGILCCWFKALDEPRKRDLDMLGWWETKGETCSAGCDQRFVGIDGQKESQGVCARIVTTASRSKIGDDCW